MINYRLHFFLSITLVSQDQILSLQLYLFNQQLYCIFFFHMKHHYTFIIKVQLLEVLLETEFDLIIPETNTLLFPTSLIGNTELLIWLLDFNLINSKLTFHSSFYSLFFFLFFFSIFLF